MGTKWREALNSAWKNQIRCTFCDISAMYETVCDVAFAASIEDIPLCAIESMPPNTKFIVYRKVCTECGGKIMGITKQWGIK